VHATDPEPLVRATVAKAIGRICTSHDELAIRALEDRVNDEREYQEVRLAADEALINLVGEGGDLRTTKYWKQIRQRIWAQTTRMRSKIILTPIS